ncbi:MAG: hypothetical protein WD972_01325, partial [Candidatus Andersenbacteria bacterium]
VIGWYGLLDSAVLKKLKYQRPVAVFELDVEQLVAHSTKTPAYEFHAQSQSPQYRSLSKYPPVFRDVSVLVAPEVRIEEVQGIIERVGKELVVDVDLFDIYRPSSEAEADEQAAASPDQQSLAFHIKYQALDHTLTDEEVATVHDKIVAALQEELAAELRE